MKIEVINGKWSVSGIILDIFINFKREIQVVKRSKITKQHNYIWKQ